jgi:peptidoglycan/LPS O-acetylase OafA/YrhL
MEIYSRILQTFWLHIPHAHHCMKALGHAGSSPDASVAIGRFDCCHSGHSSLHLPAFIFHGWHTILTKKPFNDMIQRIQSLYLFAVIVLCIASLMSDIGRFVPVEGARSFVATFSNFRLHTNLKVGLGGFWALGVLEILVILLSVFAILLYRVRMRQMRVVIFSSLLLVGYLCCYAFYVWLCKVRSTRPLMYEGFFRFFPCLCLSVICRN